MKTSNMWIGLLAALAFAPGQAREWRPAEWPVMKHYDGRHLYRIALPLGGIGTGTVSLGGRGELRDWEIMNVPAKGYSTVLTGNNAPFFALHIEAPSGSATTLLEGPLYDHEYLHCEGEPVNHHGFPRFRSASFDAAYPFGQVALSDPQLPVEVRVRGFNPLIPGRTDDSSLPIAVLVYEVTNTGAEPVEASVCGSLRNFIGKDGSHTHLDWKGNTIPDGADRNRNTFRQGASVEGIFFSSNGVDPDDPAWGTMALVTPRAENAVSYRTSSTADNWNNAILDFWDDFSTDGTLTEHDTAADADPMASLSVRKRIAPQQTEAFVFFLTWHFPNRRAWSATPVGNYYTTRDADAWAAAERIAPQIPRLERETLLFVRTLAGSDYPDPIKEAALFNLSTLRSQTVFRLPSGHLMGWEGVMDRFGSCQGSCTHVWNYELATPFLFGELARTMRDVEFNYATRPDGLMNFRAALPLSEAAAGSDAAADGQMGCVMKFYREWQLSGDRGFLVRNWERVKRVLAYAWTEGGWDGDRDGVMEGSQHNTMDVNYYGPNPQMAFWYLGALKAAEKMALEMNDRPFARTCAGLFDKGSRWIDANLFNGEYYEHRIADPATFAPLDTTDPAVAIPDFQLGPGCLVDQLAGQYMAHCCGLGYLADPHHIRTTLRHIMKYNFVSDFSRHFNNMRSFVLGDEAGLLMASWPHGRLKVPFPYFSEVMTGFEYCAATSMIHEGMYDEALTCIRAVRDRFDGARRNPFSEPECGHHYARAMASWATLLAWSGFRYSAVERRMEFATRQGTYFWSNGSAWGACRIGDDEIELTVLMGDLALDRLTVGTETFAAGGRKGGRNITAGTTLRFARKKNRAGK